MCNSWICESAEERMRGGAISRQLHTAVNEVLREKGQVILLLNRRGFATTIQCPACGHVVACPDCDMPLTHHRDGSKAVCHYCDYTIGTPPWCPACKHDGIRYAGLGTQKLEAEVRARFPNAKIARMDSDTMRRPGSHQKVLSAFRSGEIDLLLGTQMIAKGLDFPNVLLVGVINADGALHFPDFRAAERTFQLVTQVAGRTGRGDRGGRVVVQTFSPEHMAIQAASRHDYDQFAEAELINRSKFNYPPLGCVARIILRGVVEEITEATAEALLARLEAAQQNLAAEIRILGTGTATNCQTSWQIPVSHFAPSRRSKTTRRNYPNGNQEFQDSRQRRRSVCRRHRSDGHAVTPTRTAQDTVSIEVKVRSFDVSHPSFLSPSSQLSAPSCTSADLRPIRDVSDRVPFSSIAAKIDLTLSLFFAKRRCIGHNAAYETAKNSTPCSTS